jgi:hypothetical protein
MPLNSYDDACEHCHKSVQHLSGAKREPGHRPNGHFSEASLYRNNCDKALLSFRINFSKSRI